MKEENSKKEVIENESKEEKIANNENKIDKKKQEERVANAEKENEIKMQDDSEKINDAENGIEISNDVIAVIAGVAVSEVQGVSSMSGGFAGGITEVLSGKKNMAKGIKVDKTDNKAKIDVNIIVEYGSRIPDVAFEIQTRVKKAVEGMTGFKVEEVNVHVQGVNTNISKGDNTEPEQVDNEKEN